jgi:hypothetical protein
METTRSTFNQHNFKKGDKVFLFASYNGFESPTITFYVQEYTIYSIGKKQCYLIIENDVLSKNAFYCDFEYGIAKTQEQAVQICNKVMIEDIAENISRYEWRKENWKDYSITADKMIANCKTAKTEIIFNPLNKYI